MTAPVEPANVEAEEAVLGAMLLSTAAVDRAADLLQPADFWRDANGSVFSALCRLRQRSEPTEPLTVAAELERVGALAAVGGKSRIAELAATATTASNVAHYAMLVLDAARSRTVYRATLSIQKAALNGGLSLHPELLDEMLQAISDARSLPGEPAMPEEPLFVDAYEFVAQRSEAPPPLWGTREVPLIAEGSLNILAGRPGAGKTTFVLDLACALAAGVQFPSIDSGNERAPVPWPVSRPLRVAIIENEGPQEMFRGKLQDKLACFPHEIRDVGGLICVQTWAWGSFSFADPSVQQRVRRELDELAIDLVFGDPLASLGLEGVGSPAETTAFVNTLKPLGLGTSRAFLFLHHFRERVEKDEDELRRVSGAWGPHLDTLLTLQATASENEVRLNYPKVRWARGPTPKPILLGRVWNTASFESLAEEGDAAHLEPQIVRFLEQHGWQKQTDVANGISQRREAVKAALDGAPHVFRQVSGDEALRLGAKSRKTTFWGLAEWRVPGVQEAQERLVAETYDEQASHYSGAQALSATQDNELPF